jgi:hypothetical protein
LPRHPDKFDLDEDDFLTEYPVFDSFKFGEVDPPNWALRAQQKRGGHKHPKREVIHTHFVPVHSMGFTPARPAGAYGPTFPKGSDAQALFDKMSRKAQAKDEARRRAQLSKSQQQMSQRKLVPAGNLINDDYRYWRGFAMARVPPGEAVCRWCQVFYNTREAMLDHHNKSTCKTHLTALYRYAKLSSKTQRYCFACKKITDNFHWGLPLCDDVACYTKWKFNFNIQLWGYQQYREWALKDQLERGSKGPFGDLSPGPETDDDDESYFTGHC